MLNMLNQTKMTLLQKFTLLALSVVLGFAAPAHADNHGGAKAPEALLTIVTTAEAQTQMMAMVLTSQAVQKGVAARILLCGPAGALAVKDSQSPSFKPSGKSPKMLLQALLSKGVKVEVCALFLPNAGLGVDALLAGVTAAKPPVMAEALLAPNTRLLNF